MLTAALRSVTLFKYLFQLDQHLCELTRLRRCVSCKGPLYRAFYPRKPRGGPDELPSEYQVRLSLCCGKEGCRKRTLPPSCLFMGRRVYLAASVLVATVLRQQAPRSADLRRLVQFLGVSRRTLYRWLAYFAHTFPHESTWQRLRGLVSAEVRDDALPSALWESFLCQARSAQEALTRCLYFLTGQPPVSTDKLNQ